MHTTIVPFRPAPVRATAAASATSPVDPARAAVCRAVGVLPAYWAARRQGLHQRADVLLDSIDVLSSAAGEGA